MDELGSPVGRWGVWSTSWSIKASCQCSYCVGRNQRSFCLFRCCATTPCARAAGWLGACGNRACSSGTPHYRSGSISSGGLHLARMVKIFPETAERGVISTLNEEALQHARTYLAHVQERFANTTK